MAQEFISPIRKRFLLQYEAMTDEQKKRMDSYDDLPKEERYIIPIKRKRNPEISTGTVFAICLPSKRYVYGKVLKKAENLPMIEKDCYIAMLSNKTTDSLQEVSFELSESNILAGPWIVSDIFWRNGKFYSVAVLPLTADEQSLDIGFYKTDLRVNSESEMIDKGLIVDVNGAPMTDEPRYLDHCAYITVNGIEKELFRQSVLGNI